MVNEFHCVLSDGLSVWAKLCKYTSTLTQKDSDITGGHGTEPAWSVILLECLCMRAHTLTGPQGTVDLRNHCVPLSFHVPAN